MDVESRSESTDKFCPYCQSALGSRRLVHCSVCGTAHHAECWDANKGCTSFGCVGDPVEQPMAGTAYVSRSSTDVQPTDAAVTSAPTEESVLSRYGLGGIRHRDEFIHCLRNGSKIQAIKLLRDDTKLGLKEAKDLTEAIMIDIGMEPYPASLMMGRIYAALALGGFAWVFSALFSPGLAIPLASPRSIIIGLAVSLLVLMGTKSLKSSRRTCARVAIQSPACVRPDGTDDRKGNGSV